MLQKLPLFYYKGYFNLRFSSYNAFQPLESESSLKTISSLKMLSYKKERRKGVSYWVVCYLGNKATVFPILDNFLSFL